MKKVYFSLAVLHLITINGMNNHKTVPISPGLTDVMNEIGGQFDQGGRLVVEPIITNHGSSNLEEKIATLEQQVRCLKKVLKKQQEIVQTKNDEIRDLTTQKDVALARVAKLQLDINTLTGLLVEKDVSLKTVSKEKDFALTLLDVAKKTEVKSTASPNASMSLKNSRE